MRVKKRVMISGGEGGLGIALAGEFGEGGWDVLSPGRGEMDVSDSGSVDAYVKGAGDMDLMVCNAGATCDGVLAKMGEGDWDGVMDVNLRGAFYCARAVARGMVKRRGGHVVFVSSYSAFCPPVGQANYAAAKAGLEGLAKSLAKELGGRGVRVNVVVPGFLETRMTADVGDGVREVALERHVLGRFNEVGRVARFVRFLDKEMLATSGQVFHLDSRVV